jgi:hypothetical protein
MKTEHNDADMSVYDRHRIKQLEHLNKMLAEQSMEFIERGVGSWVKYNDRQIEKNLAEIEQIIKRRSSDD